MKTLLLVFLSIPVFGTAQLQQVSLLGGTFERHCKTWQFDDSMPNGSGVYFYTGAEKGYYATLPSSVPYPAYNLNGQMTGTTYNKEAWERGIIAAHAAGFRGDGIRIAVLDTGCDTLPGLHPVGGWNFIDNNADYSDGNGHGTARCSNIINKPVGNNGFWGNAPNASLYVGKMINASAASQLSWINAALDWCDTMHFDIIVCAWTFYEPSLVSRFDRLTRNGSWVVCAAGNVQMCNDSSSIVMPACFRSTIAVSGVQGGGVSKRDNSQFAYNSRLPVQGKGISYFGYTIGLSHYKDNTFSTDYGTSYTASSEGGCLAIYRQWLRSKGRDLLQYQAIADLKSRWMAKGPDGGCVAGSMSFIQ